MPSRSDGPKSRSQSLGCLSALGIPTLILLALILIALVAIAVAYLA